MNISYQARIYKIVNDINDEIYVGSTKQTLSKRFGGHKTDSIKNLTKKLYILVRESNWSNFRIILIESFECNNREEQFKREQHYIDLLKPSLNSKNAVYSKCEHNRDKSQCKECGGSQICEHNIQKAHCKECGGSQICEHNIQKAHCKECGGASICEHDKRKSHCKECGGSQICEHDKRKSHCKDCNNWGCDYCEKKYSSKLYLYRHILKHFS